MADTDRFLLETLEQSECIPAEIRITDVKEFTSTTFVAVIWRCLAKIKESEPHLEIGERNEFSDSVGVAVRHRVGSQLANILKDLGYSGDCGYNHFLYPNEKETRAILSWLVSKLPRVDATGSAIGTARQEVGHHNRDVLSDESLADIFSSWIKRRTLYALPNRSIPSIRGFERLPLRTHPLSLPWNEDESEQSGDKSLFEATPVGTSRSISILEAMSVSQCRKAVRIDTLETGDEEEGVRSTAFGGMIEEDHLKASQNVPVVHSELANPDLALPFFASANQENVVDGKDRTPTDSSASVDDPQTATNLAQFAKQGEEIARVELERVQSRLAEVQQRMDQLRAESDHEERELAAIEQRVEGSKEEAAKLAKELASRKQLLSLLPNAAENIVKLEALCAKNEAKLRGLEDEWTAHKLPFEKEEEALLSIRSNRKARYRQLVAEMKAFRAEMKEMVPRIQQKMDELQGLDQVYARLPRNLSRNSYTNRIMDIIKQVHKQKQEINKIIDDIKIVQKQLNVSSEKLKRTEAVTEDKLFSEASKQAASKDPNNPYVECYRKFAQVRELFEELIAVAGDVGKKENTARDLENWITQLQGRDSSAQLEKVLSDLQSVRRENAALTDQLRALRSLPTL